MGTWVLKTLSIPSRSLWVSVVGGATVIVLVGMSACESSSVQDGAPAGFVRSDSAGIEILTSVFPAWSEESGWRVGPAPSLEIGSRNGQEGEIFHEIVRVQLVGEGLLVAQRTELRFYDAAGRLVRTLGGRGGGPGEFDWIVSALACGERVVASEVTRFHLTAFDAEGAASSIPLPSPEDLGRWRPLSLRGCLGESLVGELPGAMVVLREEEAKLDTLLVYQWTETHKGLIVPFGGGSRTAFRDNLMYMVDTRVPEVRVMEPEGAPRRIIRLPLLNQSVTPADTERKRAEYLDVRGEHLRETIEGLLSEVTIPSTMPLFSQLEVGPDGTVWLRAYQPFRDEMVTRWFVVAPNGHFLGSVDLPSRFSVHEFGNEDVVGVWLDELDVEFVHRYSIER